MTTTDPHIGQRVILASLMAPEHHPGTIVSVNGSMYSAIRTVTVKLDRQAEFVNMVVYCNSKPVVIESSYWQACWPE